MATPLPADALSLTAGGAALVTAADGSIDAGTTTGFFVDDCRSLSSWRLFATDATLTLVSRVRRDAGADRLLYTVGVGDVIDPVALLERQRTVSAGRLLETLRLTAFAEPLEITLRLQAERDDATVYALDEGKARQLTVVADGSFALVGDDGPAVAVTAPGWRLIGDELQIVAAAEPDMPFAAELDVVVGAARPAAAPTATLDLASSPPTFATLVRRAHEDLAGLTIGVPGGGSITAAGSPFFLALFGRDSLISGMQSVLGAPSRLLDTLDQLAAHQGDRIDPATRAQPGRILHELRLGRMGVFGVEPGSPYYGAADVNALFVVALGEAARWGAAPERVAALLPAARRALTWCDEYGDVDGDGFIELAPDAGGLTNLGWKDSSDSMVGADGAVYVGPVALSEVQAYWYRACRAAAELERWLGEGDGAAHDARAGELAEAITEHFVVDVDGAPFVALALDGDKQPLASRTSNAGHVLWSGALPTELGRVVAEQLAAADLASGWGLRTLSAANPGYNPFGYHRGSVWPHDTAIAVLGASRYGADDTVRSLSAGLVALAVAADGELPELASGIARDDVDVPVPYLAACRPQAWSTGAPLMLVQALLGLEPDATVGAVRLRPQLADGDELELRDLDLGAHRLSLRVRGHELVEVDSELAVVADGEPLAATPWGVADAPA